MLLRFGHDARSASRRGDGKDYFFVTRTAFDAMVAGDELLEHAEYVGNCYGTPKSYVERRCAEGMHVLLDIDVQGVHQISENGRTRSACS